uniref:Uncharacterized protein n=1 Tax=viral metagenome TaxID=1070528 RepID=A0A6M3KXI7_9ZZZZ
MLSIPNDLDLARNVYSSLLAFSRIPETKPMMLWLKSELDRLDMVSRHERDTNVAGELRGARQCLEFLFESIAVSSEKASRITDNINKNKGVRS